MGFFLIAVLLFLFIFVSEHIAETEAPAAVKGGCITLFAISFYLKGVQTIRILINIVTLPLDIVRYGGVTNARQKRREKEWERKIKEKSPI